MTTDTQWQIINDLLESVRLADDSDDQHIYNTVVDYVVNHYDSDTTVCGYCGTTITYVDSLWIDGTDGDCCCGDDEGNNDGNPHTPWKD